MKKHLLNALLGASLMVFIFTSCLKDTPESEALHDLQLEESTQLISYQTSSKIEGHYIVVFNEGALGTKKSAISKENYKTYQDEMKTFAQNIFGERKMKQKEIAQTYVKAIQGVAVELSDLEVEELQKDKRVKYVEQDQTYHVSMGGPPGGNNGGNDPQVTPWGVTRVGGPVDGTTSGKAWIIDSGIDLDHPDLNVDVANSVSFLSGGGGNLSPDDYNGHGTHVAGTVAAIDNEIGVIGVAAGAEVVAVRVLDRRGNGTTSGVIAGVDYVAANASSGDVANMSLGGGVSTALDNAVSDASSTCPFTLAAGNESQNANNSSPARVNGSDIYTVSSMAQGDIWSSFSNYGNPPVDYCAPGSSVFSTYKGGGYATLSGTSMAAPHVCGILLIGGISTDGTVTGDPDGNADDIAHL